MHQAIPYKPIKLPGGGASASATTSAVVAAYPLFPSSGSEFVYEMGDTHKNQHHPAVMIKNMVLQNPVIVIGRRGCCMGHVVKRLLLSLGVNPAIHEVDDDRAEQTVSEELLGCTTSGDQLQFPAVFIGGRLFGGLETVMAAHISGELTPILKEAGALWL